MPSDPGGHSKGEAQCSSTIGPIETLPGRVPAQLDLYSKLAYPVQLRYMGEPHYYLVSESGQLNTLVHGWIYESAADREAKRAKMMQDPDWKHFLAENAKAGNVIEQTNWLMTPAAILAEDFAGEDREVGIRCAAMTTPAPAAKF